uniref:Uncharacterized protein n=1 Tax=Heliothis virescens TaxID=7102 RepID=A0A2A4K9L6_HELVI
MPYMCAFGCGDKNVVLHAFPNPKRFPERFKLWVNLVEGLESLSENDIREKKRICDIHFSDEHRVRYKRLSALAVPTLHLPSNKNNDESENVSDARPRIIDEEPGSAISDNQKLDEAASTPVDEDTDNNVTGEVQESRESSPSPVEEEPYVPIEVKEACRICLSFNVKMYRLQEYDLSQMLYDITGIKVGEEDGIFQYVCFECAARLSAASAFRHKAITTDGMLQRLLNCGDTEACRICLSFNVKMYRLQEYDLSQMLYDITGIKVGEEDGIFQYVCFECAARLSAASAFRHKAITTDGMLQRLLNCGDTLADYLIHLKENHEILKPILTKQEAFHTTDISKDDPNNKMADLMDIDDIPNYNDTITKVFGLKQDRKIIGFNKKLTDIVKTYCDIETIDNTILAENIKINENATANVVIEQIELNHSDIINSDLTQENVELNKGNIKDLCSVQENVATVENMSVITAEELSRMVIQRFKEIKCCKLTELAQEFGITAQIVQNILDNAGFKRLNIKQEDVRKKIPPRINEQLRKRVISLKLAGATVSEIVKLTGVSKASIYMIWQRWLKEKKQQPGETTEKNEPQNQNAEKITVLPIQEYDIEMR